MEADGCQRGEGAVVFRVAVVCAEGEFFVDCGVIGQSGYFRACADLTGDELERSFAVEVFDEWVYWFVDERAFVRDVIFV